MAAGTVIKHKRKAANFIGGELAAGEWGLNTNSGAWFFSVDGLTVTALPVGGGGGGAAITETEVDFGSAAIKEKTFTITDAAVSANSKILSMQSGKAATGRQADENEFDVISFRAVPSAGQFTLYATCLTGRVQGLYKVVYQAS